jgi:hypothetical protein
MPPAEEILRQLATLANEQRLVAGFWHLVLVAVAIALATGWRPSRRRAAVNLSAPCASVAILAFAYGNPFNATAFAVLAAMVVALGVGVGDGRAASGPWWTTLLGIAMVSFGFVYPHFVEVESVLEYLYAAPAGVIPCPTLAVVIGLTLIADGFGSRGYMLIVAGAGLFYGIFGATHLGVPLDFVLLLGAATLGGRAVLPGSRVTAG